MNALDAPSLEAWAYVQVDMHPHYPTLIRYASECQTVVEWGVRGGVSTWALLEGLPPDGRLYSVDIVLGDLPVPVTSDDRWTFILGDDLDPAVQAQLPDTADMVFIDTDHTYPQTVGELAYAQTFNPARIVMHDYVMDPVRQAADEFCAREGWAVIANELPFGLATLVRS